MLPKVENLIQGHAEMIFEVNKTLAPEQKIKKVQRKFANMELSEKKRMQNLLRDEYLEQMRQQRQKKIDERRLEKDEQKRRIEQAHMSLDLERAEKQRLKEQYQQDLSYQDGQRQAMTSSLLL